MNRTESAYAEVLDLRKRCGEIQRWDFEKVTLKLADDCRYTPDFFLIDKDGYVEFHETKGFFRDDAKVKIRVAAEQFPFFRFVLVTWKAKQWSFKNY